MADGARARLRPSPLTRVALRLDHASIAVPDLAEAVEQLDRRLGLRATGSPQAPERHSRVYLHRSYLEVSAGSAGAGWQATLFFLRFDDPAALRTHLDGVGMQYRFGQYEGVDGTWDDVEIRAGTVPLPMLVRRTTPPAVARDWPPALGQTHPCGARTLAAVHLEVPSLKEAVEAYRRLLGAEQVSWADHKRRARGKASARLASGEIVLHEGVSGAALGLVLGVPSLAATRIALEGRFAPVDEDVAWMHRGQTFGLRLGFAELGGGPAGRGSRSDPSTGR
jgi:catechol 2,3-dioxygenase-like lactoylglutathione lyase family enzyme